MDSLLLDYVKHCPICLQTSKTIHRLDPINPIIVEGPYYRYEFYISYLNQDLSSNFGTKYLFNIIDPFSRKDMVYSINTKKDDVILQYDFCLYNIFPMELGSDNGPSLRIVF